eukprot:scaffold4335_cov119-Cylindrotheca_fusiformis.AAC.3
MGISKDVVYMLIFPMIHGGKTIPENANRFKIVSSCENKMASNDLVCSRRKTTDGREQLCRTDYTANNQTMTGKPLNHGSEEKNTL